MIELEKFTNLKELAEDTSAHFGSVWDSALVSDENGNYHAVICEEKDDFIVRTESDSKEKSWLCDYIEAVDPSSLLALLAHIDAQAERIAELGRRYDEEVTEKTRLAIARAEQEIRAEVAEKELAALRDISLTNNESFALGMTLTNFGKFTSDFQRFCSIHSADPKTVVDKIDKQSFSHDKPVEIGPEKTVITHCHAPEGWKLVPVEPTESMIVEGFESEPDEDFSKPEVWKAYQNMSGCRQATHRAKLCWAAMLAAAPDYEEANRELA